MSNAVATRKDIDDVLDLLRTFMQQVDERFSVIEKDISELKESHNRLLNTIDGFVSRIDLHSHRNTKPAS